MFVMNVMEVTALKGTKYFFKTPLVVNPFKSQYKMSLLIVKYFSQCFKEFTFSLKRNRKHGFDIER